MSTRADTADTRFWTRVGEPRGVGTRPVIGSQAGYIQYYMFTRPFDWVLTRFTLFFLLSLVPVLLSLVPN